MFDFEFFPTPHDLVLSMLNKVNFSAVTTVLEPSAGKATLANAVLAQKKYGMNDFDVDVIEIDPNLQVILKSYNHRLIHDDFLTFKSYKKYDLIIMNPPFSNGEKHLNKALDLIEYSGGQLVCLLMDSSIRNPYTNERKALATRLKELNADISFFDSPFASAEVKTSVDVAMIYVNVPKKVNESIILNHLKAEERFNDSSYKETNELIKGNLIEGLIEQCSFEISCGVKLINDMNYLNRYMFDAPLFENKRQSGSRYSNNRLEITSNGQKTDVNSFVNATRLKYWKSLFDSDEFETLLTNDLRSKYSNTLNDLANYDFSLFNITQIKGDLRKLMSVSIEDTIINLFDEFSRKHSFDQFSKNIHLYNGWKTNKAWKINKKIIIPLNATNWHNDELRIDYYTVINKLLDIEKVMNYLDVSCSENIDLKSTLEKAQESNQFRKIKLKHFMVTFYKKKTCHIEFTNLKALDKFNIFGSQKKGWLPPSYGSKKYFELMAAEREIIDSFEGQEHYDLVCTNSNEYIFRSNGLLRLSA